MQLARQTLADSCMLPPTRSYFLKVTLGRKGLLKSNERWVVPIVYVPRQHDPPLSDQRMLATAAGLAIPGPLVDPGGWSGKKVRHVVKRGLFARSGGKAAWYEVALLLPMPAKFPRTSTVPFALKVSGAGCHSAAARRS